MSIRPTNIIQCQNVTAVEPVSPCYVIVGNTSLSTIYAAKIEAAQLQTGTNYPIYILTTGVDLTTNVNDIESLSYVARNSRLTSRDMVVERIHNILTSEPTFLSDQFKIYNEYLFWFSGAGPLGDSITSYYQAFVGPWFTFQSMSQISDFLKGWTLPYPLSRNEGNIATNLANLLGLAFTNSVIATKPSILTTNHIFVEQPQSQALQRQIFYDTYLETRAPENIHYINRVNNIFIENIPNGDGCRKNVHYSTTNAPYTQSLSDACIVWATNLYNYVHILGESNIPHNKIKIPVFYRARMVIPKVNPDANGLLGNNLSDIANNGICLSDGLTTRLTMSVGIPPQPGTAPNSNSGSINWNISVYTTDDDLSSFIESGGSFIRPCPTGATGPCPCVPGQTMLIVEGTSLNNRRSIVWDNLNLSISQSLNSNVIELNTYSQFQHICEIVYQAYTCYLPEAETQPGITCTTAGICDNTFPLDHTFNRESPQTMVLRMLGDLFSGNSYPNPNVASNTRCCANGIVI